MDIFAGIALSSYSILNEKKEIMFFISMVPFFFSIIGTASDIYIQHKIQVCLFVLTIMMLKFELYFIFTGQPANGTTQLGIIHPCNFLYL